MSINKITHKIYVFIHWVVIFEMITAPLTLANPPPRPEDPICNTNKPQIEQASMSWFEQIIESVNKVTNLNPKIESKIKEPTSKPKTFEKVEELYFKDHQLFLEIQSFRERLFSALRVIIEKSNGGQMNVSERFEEQKIRLEKALNEKDETLSEEVLQSIYSTFEWKAFLDTINDNEQIKRNQQTIVGLENEFKIRFENLKHSKSEYFHLRDDLGLDLAEDPPKSEKQSFDAKGYLVAISKLNEDYFHSQIDTTAWKKALSLLTPPGTPLEAVLVGQSRIQDDFKSFALDLQAKAYFNQNYTKALVVYKKRESPLIYHYGGDLPFTEQEDAILADGFGINDRMSFYREGLKENETAFKTLEQYGCIQEEGLNCRALAFSHSAGAGKSWRLIKAQAEEENPSILKEGLPWKIAEIEPLIEAIKKISSENFVKQLKNPYRNVSLFLKGAVFLPPEHDHSFRVITQEMFDQRLIPATQDFQSGLKDYLLATAQLRGAEAAQKARIKFEGSLIKLQLLGIDREFLDSLRDESARVYEQGGKNIDLIVSSVDSKIRNHLLMIPLAIIRPDLAIMSVVFPAVEGFLRGSVDNIVKGGSLGTRFGRLLDATWEHIEGSSDGVALLYASLPFEHYAQGVFIALCGYGTYENFKRAYDYGLEIEDHLRKSGMSDDAPEMIDLRSKRMQEVVAGIWNSGVTAQMLHSVYTEYAQSKLIKEIQDRINRQMDQIIKDVHKPMTVEEIQMLREGLTLIALIEQSGHSPQLGSTLQKRGIKDLGITKQMREGLQIDWKVLFKKIEDGSLCKNHPEELREILTDLLAQKQNAEVLQKEANTDPTGKLGKALGRHKVFMEESWNGFILLINKTLAEGC